jgi:vacuolar-type H+-ATPase subunit E/Vma4
MALEDIFRALEEQADKDIEATLAEARAHAKVITDDAKREAEETQANRLADAERAARSKSSQSLNSVRLEARKRIASVKDQAVRQVFEQSAAALAKVRARKDYADVFSALAAEAIAGVEGDYEVWVDAADLELAKRVVGAKAPVKGQLSSSGGLVVVTQGGRVLRRNTLEDRLAKFRGIAQADVAEIVFA